MDAKTRPFLLGLLAAVAVAGASRAQVLSDQLPPSVPGFGTVPGETVASRPQPLYDSQGSRLDGLWVRPELDQSVGYDGNVLGSNASGGSWIVGTRPSLLVQSTAPRDPFALYFSLNDARYLDLPAQSRIDWVGSGGGTIDIGQDKLTLSAAHLSLHQDRTDLDALPSDRPVAYQVNDLRAGYASGWNRFSVEPNIDLSTWRFGATTIFGVPASQAYRDRDVLQGGVTLRYETAPQRSALFVLRGTDQLYVAPAAGAPSLDSTGWAALAGLADEGEGIWHWRVLAGWERRAFAARQYGAYGGPVAEADLSFSPGGMTTITAVLSHSLQDAAQEEVAGFAYTLGKLTLDYEWRRNVLLQGSLGLQRADLLQGGGQQTAYTLGLGATWLLNRRMRLLASYSFADTRSTEGSVAGTAPLGGSFVRNLWTLTLRLAL